MEILYIGSLLIASFWGRLIKVPRSFSNGSFVALVNGNYREPLKFRFWYFNARCGTRTRNVCAILFLIFGVHHCTSRQIKNSQHTNYNRSSSPITLNPWFSVFFSKLSSCEHSNYSKERMSNIKVAKGVDIIGKAACSELPTIDIKIANNHFLLIYDVVLQLKPKYS